MAKITDYATLKTNVADWLNRSDLTDVIPTFVQLAEQGFERDDRCRKVQYRGTFTISADGASLPSDYMAMEGWWHDGPSYYGPIEIVGPEQLGGKKARLGDTGAPSFAALVDGVAYFAPAPDGAYTTKMTYLRKIVPLSDSNTTNWLLTDHPDVYLYGTLVESAPYLKDDGRIEVWLGRLEKALNELHRATWNAQWSGTMKRQRKAIGG